MKSGLLTGLLAAVAMAAIAGESFYWNENFSSENALSSDLKQGWKSSAPEAMSVKLENGHLLAELDRSKGTGAKAIRRLVPADFRRDDGPRYLRIRLNAAPGKIHIFANGVALAPMFDIRPGFYTFPVNDILGGPALGKYRQWLMADIYFTRQIDMSEFQATAAAPDGVYVTADRPAGTVLQSGDELKIAMPVAGEVDKLALALYRIAVKAPKFSGVGVWETVDWPGVPPTLTRGADGVYRATIPLPSDRDFSACAGQLVVGVEYLGADSRTYGNFYGIVPFAVEMKKSGGAPAASVAGRP